MSEIIPYLWLAISVLSAVAEFLTSKRFWVWCVPSAVIAFAMSLFLFSVKSQVFVFTIITLILIILSRTFLKNLIKFRISSTNSGNMENMASLLGKPAVVVQEINNMENMGVIKIRGAEWSARTLDDDVIYEIGDIVYVNKVQGNNLVCEK